MQIKRKFKGLSHLFIFILFFAMILVDRKWGFWLIDLGNFRKLGQDF